MSVNVDRSLVPESEYIAELNKARIKLPSIVGFVGAVGVVIVVGRVVR